MKLRTKLSLAECRERLGSATDLRGLALSWDGEGPGTVVGEFRGSMFRLHTRKYYNNAFAPFFYGKLTEADGGAILEGGFRMNPFVRLSMLFLISCVLLFGAAAIIVPAPAQPSGGVGGRGWFFGGLALAAILGVGLVQAGKWLGRGEQEVIHAFLKSTLEADDEPSST
jgi:hypothetical protein